MLRADRKRAKQPLLLLKQRAVPAQRSDEEFKDGFRGRPFVEL